jgi:hypothetical protein
VDNLRSSVENPEIFVRLITWLERLTL